MPYTGPCKHTITNIEYLHAELEKNGEFYLMTCPICGKKENVFKWYGHK